MAALGDGSSVSDLESLDGSLADLIDFDNEGPDRDFDVEVGEDGEFLLSPMPWRGGGGDGAGGAGAGGEEQDEELGTCVFIFV